MTNKQQYVVTVGAVLLYYLFSSISFYDYPKGYSFPEKHQMIGLFALGLMPVYSGFMLGEIFSFFLPPLSQWRKEGVEGRKKLHLMELIIVLTLAGLQSWQIVSMTQSFKDTNPLVLWGMSGLTAQLVLGLCLVGGVLVFYSLASMVSRYGALNGFILFLFIAPLRSKIDDLLNAFRIDRRLNAIDQLAINPLLRFKFTTLDQKMDLIFILFAVVGLFTVLFQKRKSIKVSLNRYLVHRPVLTYKSEMKSYQVKGSPLPQTITAGFSIFVFLFQTARYKEWILPLGGTAYSFLWATSDVLDYGLGALLLWLLFSNRRWTNYQLEGSANWESGKDEFKRYFLFWLAVITTSTFCRDFFHLSSLSQTLNELWMILLNPVSIITLVVLGREMIEKVKFDRLVSDRVCVVEMDNVALVQLWAAQLEEENITFHVEGLRYRQLTQFFDAFLKMRLFVDKNHLGRVLNIIQIEKVKQI